ncbi:unnamed protein product [Rotaria socialis]|uniref:BRCT domain-containing protein n=2 Tax=Rotaria socialis TaxID=392032 RepID=A0A820S672_9BILA|nr:unnamed protein product [Rotaria socialis]CAF4147925.1 unnamed protein product [Rotaria socialis]CAF4421239.1 unnamed protein product [Rotaria socialis]CAF4450735.1 unnamed protein product [Rotaria socialis]
MLRPPSTVRSSGLRPPIHSSQQQKHSIQRSRNQASHQTNSIARSTNKSTNDISVQSRPSIFPRNQAHTPMPSLARRTSIGATRPSNVQKQSHDEISSYAIKQACNQLNYDYEYLIEEKRRIGYTGAGIIIPSRTEVDEFLLKNIDVPLGIWIYKYVRLYPGEPLAQNINERQFVPERLDQSEPVNIVRPTLRTQRQTTRILDLFGDKSNTNECQPKSNLPHHSQIKSGPQLPILKHSETQIIKTILDDDEFDRDKAIQTRELKYSDLRQQLMEQLRKLQSIDDSDINKISAVFYAIKAAPEIIVDMSSPGNYAKGYVRSTAGGKRVMWDGARWQQLCQIEKCFKRDQKSQGVCLIHYREQQEAKTKNKNKKFKQEEKPEKIKLTKDKKSNSTKRTSISTRPRRIKSTNSINDSTKAFDNDYQNSDIDISYSEITERKSSTSNINATKSQKPSSTLVLVCSSLTRQQISQVELFCSRFCARLSNQIDETTTHLIASEVEQRICCLTKKVFFAVAYHQYVIGYQWIEECLNKQCLLNEDSYEITGDASLSGQHNGMNRSRLTRQPIFKSYPYAIAVECSIGCQQGMFTRIELENLVELSGATILRDQNRQQLDMNITIVVLCDDDDKAVVKKYIGVKNKIYYVIPEFFLDSVVLYEVQPIKGYELLYQIE